MNRDKYQIQHQITETSPLIQEIKQKLLTINLTAQGLLGETELKTLILSFLFGNNFGQGKNNPG